jgi:hypothetical protein
VVANHGMRVRFSLPAPDFILDFMVKIQYNIFIY